MKTIERISLYVLLVVIAALLLRAAPGPTAHADEPAPSDPPRIAVCAVVKIMDELMETDRFKPDRLEQEESLRTEKLQPLIDEARELQQQAEGLARDDPKITELRERMSRVQREGERVSREIMQTVEKKVAEQLIECYALVRASAAAVAEERGFTYVLASGDPEEPTKSAVVMRVMRETLARPVIVSPKSADITDDVRLDLKLE